MWRRFGDAGYALLVLAIFTIEAFGLAGLTWAFLLRRTGLGPDAFGLGEALVAAVAATALALMVLTVYTITYQVISSRRERRYAKEVLSWTDRWIDVVFGDDDLAPAGPLPAAGVDALLDLRESVSGEAAATIRKLVSGYGIDAGLIGRVRGHLRGPAVESDGTDEPRRKRLAAALSPEGFASRLDALDGLARARSPEAVPTLMAAATDPDPAVRMMAVRALARSASAIPHDPDREAAAAQIVELLHAAEVSSGAIGEALQLLEDAAPYAVAQILDDPQRFGHRFVCAALDAIGRLGLTEFVHIVVRFADHRRIAVRAAAIRALGDLGRITSRAQPVIRHALRDRNEVVRIEAARAARLLDPKAAVRSLRPLLEDPAWTVRRVAAASLAAVGEPGRRVLTETALEHTDPHARSVASQVLVESRAFTSGEKERDIG